MSSSPQSSSQDMSDSPCSSRPASPPLPLPLQNESQSTSPERTSQQSDPVAQYFGTVPTEGFPTENKQKAQPWKRVWKPQPPTEDGKLIVACPKICVFGSNNLGGL